MQKENYRLLIVRFRVDVLVQSWSHLSQHLTEPSPLNCRGFLPTCAQVFPSSAMEVWDLVHKQSKRRRAQSVSVIRIGPSTDTAAIWTFDWANSRVTFSWDIDCIEKPHWLSSFRTVSYSKLFSLQATKPSVRMFTRLWWSCFLQKSTRVCWNFATHVSKMPFSE